MLKCQGGYESGATCYFINPLDYIVSVVDTLTFLQLFIIIINIIIMYYYYLFDLLIKRSKTCHNHHCSPLLPYSTLKS